MFRYRRVFFLFLLSLGRFGASLSGQDLEFNHSELKWRTIETEHFFVHFHEGTGRTAALVAKIAEDIYEPVTTLYQYEPDTKVHFIIKDYNDYANGAAYYYDNKIEFWAPAVLDFPFRGTHSWLRNTITHEFSHMISLASCMKFPRRLQAFYFQWLGYEKEKRRDVIHGYPSTLVSIPYPGTVVPMWFAEGMAQFQRTGLDYEIWDTHRDMLLRTAVLSDQALSMRDMGYFGKKSLGNERVYNQGYGLTRYIASHYGESSLKDLTRAMARKTRISFSKASEEVLGKSDQALYDEWMTWLKKGYSEQMQTLQNHKREGKPVEAEGFANFYAVWSPDSRKVAYLSNRGHDYLSLRDLWIYDTDTQKSTRIKSGIASSVSWSPDGEKLVYARHKNNKFKSRFFELFTYDLKLKKEKQITKSLRARQPDWGRNGRIVCVIESDGISNLVICDADGGNLKQITAFEDGQSIHLPRWTPDGSIVFALDEPVHGRDIAMIQEDGTGMSYLIKTSFDERDPWPSADGRSLYYSSDRSGIFNIYRRTLTTGEDTLLTNVTGGAFLPAVNARGQCLFSRFDADGFKLVRMDTLRAVDTRWAEYSSPYAGLGLPEDSRQWSIRSFDDTQVPVFKSTEYKPLYAKFIFLPRIFMDYPGKIKLGTYCYSADFLEKFSFFGGAAVNSQLDTDLYGIFEYKKFKPTLFLELYQVRRKSSEEDDFIRYDKIHFNLLGATVGMETDLDEMNHLRVGLDYSRYRSSVSGIVKYQNAYFKFATDYHKGAVLSTVWTHRQIPPTLQSHIAPRHGRHFQVQVDYAMQKFFDFIEEDSETGLPLEVYKPYRYFQTSFDWHEYMPSVWKSHSIALRFRGGYIDRFVDPFYHLYAGGLDGMKGYPFYSLEGRKLGHMNAAYRFPLSRNLNLNLAMFYFKEAYLSLYGDIGNAWESDTFKISDWKRDVGIQLRMSMYTYYAFPMKVAFDAAYGLDTISVREYTYGKEWRYYFTVLFDFMDLTASGRRMFLR